MKTSFKIRNIYIKYFLSILHSLKNKNSKSFRIEICSLH